MNTESCDMQRVTDRALEQWVADVMDGKGKPGEFMIVEREASKAEPDCYPRDREPSVTVRIFCGVLPGGHYVSIPIRPVPQTDKPINGGHSWEWDGNADKPTLMPSINYTGRWHGWVRSGRFVSC